MVGGGIFAGTSLVVLKLVPATFGDFDFLTQKNTDFGNSSWIFFPVKVFEIFCRTKVNHRLKN